MPTVVELEIDPRLDPLGAWLEGSQALARLLEVEGIAKAAVPTHHSQFQQRASGGKFEVRGPHHIPLREAGTGKFRQRLSREECQVSFERAKELVEEQMAPRLDEHLSDLQAGRLERHNFEERAGRDIRWFYDQAYREGKRAVGDPGVKLTPTDRAILNRLVADELHYLQGFAADLEEGKVGRYTPAQRMAMYARATWEPFWVGWVMGDLRAGRSIRWKLGEAEHCTDCLRFAAMGWVPVLQFVAEVLAKGYSPGSGQLECVGIQCRCRLEERVP